MKKIHDLIQAMQDSLATLPETVSDQLLTALSTASSSDSAMESMAGVDEDDSLLRFQSYLLYSFFLVLANYLRDQFGMRCVDAQMPSRCVVKERDCYLWFEGALRGGKPERQQFGSFFDFGDPRYLFHVEVGTAHLHVGVVRYRQDGETIVIVHMDEFDHARLNAILSRRLPDTARPEPRSWGHRWRSVDCGDFRSLAAPHVVWALLDLPGSPLAHEVLSPLARVLLLPERDRAWAWQVFDRRQWFRFFVDGRLQRKYAGWRGYEDNEAGSVQGMLDGFNYLLEHLDRAATLDVPYLLELHRLCMRGVRTGNRKSTPGEVRFREAGFLFYAHNSTLSSLAEVFEQRRGDGTPLFHDAAFAHSSDDLSFLQAHAAIKKLGKLRYRPWYPRLLEADRKVIESLDGSSRFLSVKAEIQSAYLNRMQALVDAFNSRIAVASQDIDVLLAIARIARDLELLHPFPDGNGRLFPVALMSQLLMYHGYPPPIFRDPNIDAELSYAEFTAEMISAMRNTLALIENPEAVLFDYSITESPQADIDAFAYMARALSGRADMLSRRGMDDGIFPTPDYLAWVTGGHWLGYTPGLRFTGAGSHRSYNKGYLYFGLATTEWKKVGKDIEAELKRIIAKGVSALVLEKPVDVGQYPLPVLVVDDLQAALRRLAHQTRLDVGCRTLLVTGTEGKTGAKVQLHHLLKHQVDVHAVLNSANTEGPVLFSLVNLRPSTQVEINEVSVGAIETMRVERAQLVSPDICLFTNIGPNHMDMHKTIDNVILAKSCVVEGLPLGGIAIINGFNEYAQRLIDAISRRRPDVVIHTYGKEDTDRGQLLDAQFDEEHLGWRVSAVLGGESLSYFLPLLPNHAPLASVGVLLAVQTLGYDVHQAARDYFDFHPYETMGRVIRFKLEGGDALFYDQSRRGGMHGMRAAFQDLAQFRVSGRIVALVGGISIKKDSDWTRQAHSELAELINSSRIDRLYTTGNYMDYVHAALNQPDRLVAHLDDIESLAQTLGAELRPGDLLFIIGSAYLYLGRVSDLLLQRIPNAIHGT